MIGRALVVGGTGEIGAAIARLLLDEGASVVVAGDRPAPQGRLPEGVPSVAVDVRDRNAARALVQEVASGEGLDACVYAAGIAHERPLADESDESWDELLAVNLGGAFAVGQAAAASMAPTGRGSLLFISSIDAFAPAYGYAAYAVSKAGLLSLTRSFAVEFASHGIRVNALCPGHIDTELSRTSGSEEYQRAVMERCPMGRPGTVDEVAGAAAFLLSDRASYITGSALVVDGGTLRKW